MKVTIILRGCDDSTEIKKDVNEDELRFLMTLAKEAATEASYQCMPTIGILSEDGQVLFDENSYEE